MMVFQGRSSPVSKAYDLLESSDLMCSDSLVVLKSIRDELYAMNIIAILTSMQGDQKCLECDTRLLSGIFFLAGNVQGEMLLFCRLATLPPFE